MLTGAGSRLFARHSGFGFYNQAHLGFGIGRHGYIAGANQRGPRRGLGACSKAGAVPAPKKSRSGIDWRNYNAYFHMRAITTGPPRWQRV